MTELEQRVEVVYLDAIQRLVSLMGHPEFGREPAEGVDLERLPAPTVRAARVAVDLLCVGLGIMDPDTPSDDHVTADEFLARITASAES